MSFLFGMMTVNVPDNLCGLNNLLKQSQVEYLLMFFKPLHKAWTSLKRMSTTDPISGNKKKL